MRRGLLSVLVCVAALGGAGIADAEEALYKYKGRSVGPKDLPPALQQKHFELMSEIHGRLADFVEGVVLERYAEDQAVKDGKSKTEVLASLLRVPDPTDDEVKTWFEENRARLPPEYKLEQVAPEIKRLLTDMAGKRRRSEVVAKLGAEGVVSGLPKEPVAPLFTIDTKGLPFRGAEAAKVTLVEFADYQCPHCKAAKPVLEKVLAKYAGKVKFVFMDFPVNPSGISKKVAWGAVCAAELGKFWEYHDRAYEQQKTLDEGAPLRLAQELKLDEARFKACMDSKQPSDRVAKSLAEAERLGISGTPSIFINGRLVRGHDEAGLGQAIEQALK